MRWSPFALLALLSSCSSLLGFEEVEFDVPEEGQGGESSEEDAGSGGDYSPEHQGGGPGEGGAPNQGGVSNQGGAPGDGGTPNQGGGPGEGGAPNQGGGPGEGGAPNQGGTPNQGGAPGPVCPDNHCDASESCASCPEDCGSCCGNSACDTGESCDTCPEDCPCPVSEPNQLVGIHFWDESAAEVMGGSPYYDVEAFESAIDANTLAAWLAQREDSGARVIVRIDYQWGNSIPKGQGERDTYSSRLVAIAKAVDSAGLQSHHYVVGNESNLPQEGSASPSEVGEAYASARGAIDANGPWRVRPLLLTTPPSTAAEFGGGDGSYLRDLLNESKARTDVDAIAIHAYENHDGGGSANLFMGTVNFESAAIRDAGLAGKPIFITEMNVDINQAGDATGAAFVANAYARLNVWNQGGEGNPMPGQLKIVAGCWFVWHNDGNWTHLALNESSHPQTREAFRSAVQSGYLSGWP